MYVKLLAGTALVALATPAAAQTVIDTARTTPINTSTAGNDLRIGTNGSVTVIAGTAVTVDSDDNLTLDGKIAIANADNANGVQVLGPRTADVTISPTGTVTVDETYNPADSDNDGDKDGPFAVGTNRAGIRIDGPLTGKLTQNGTIAVEGNASYGIIASSTLTGAPVHEGKTTVLGDNSTAVSLQDVTGDVRLAGTVGATGSQAVGARFDGDIGGRLTVQGTITATGYRATAAPSDVSKLDADDLLQGGSALLVEGDVARGIVLAVAPRDAVASDNDEDKDGLPDDKEGSAKIMSYGAAPAVAIGSASGSTAIGATVGTGSGFGLINEGTIAGDGVYSGVSATGLSIAGRGHQVTIANGILNSGTISAAAKTAGATAVRFGAGTLTPELRNAGTISAAVTGTSGQAVAVDIAAGANVATLRNSGTIRATAVAAGSTVGVRDASGTVALVENSGKILATGSAATGGNVAIDLSARASGAMVKQVQVAAGIAPPAIEGNILFGSGADTLDLGDGSMKGDVVFGTGDDLMKLTGDAVFSGRATFGGQADRLQLSTGSIFDGTADFGGGAATVTIADNALFSGRMLGSQNAAVSLTGGFLDLRGANSLGSLAVGANGVLVVTLDKDAGAATAITVGGAASFATGAKLKLRLGSLEDAEGTYAVLTAGTLSGAGGLTTDSTLVPFLYKAALAVSGTTLSVDLDRKTTVELGLNAAETAAFDALYEALLEDDDAAAIFLGVQDGDLFRAYVQQTLPDFAGGTFEGISQGLRSLDRHLIDPEGPFDQEGTWRPVFDFVSWNGKKGAGDSAAYDLDGLGFRGGIEYVTGLGAFGVSGSWLWNKHRTGVENKVTSTGYEAGLHWRGHFGALQTFARAGYGTASFEGSRMLAGTVDGDTITYDYARDWSGDFLSAAGGLSLEGGSRYFFFRPSVVVDYLRLSEDGYSETSEDDTATENDALDLTVDARTSDELAVNAGMALGVDLFGMKSRDRSWLRLEVEGGWRQRLAGELGTTTARYGDGDEFTLLPDQRGSGWFARLRGFGGDGFYTIGGEAGLEERFGRVGYQLRASLRFGL